MRVNGILSLNPGHGVAKLRSWVQIARLQFYPMAVVAYSLGAAAAFEAKGDFNLSVCLVGYGTCFLIEFCTILTNEYFDYETDRLNRNFSIFTGGTRVLVEGKLTFREVRIAIVIALLLIVVIGYVLVRIDRGVSSTLIAGFILGGILMGLGYTVPPVNLSYRGLGETTVGITHTFYLVLCGYVFQGGDLHLSLPWLLSVPLFLAVFAAILLAGLPDRLADSRAGKRTLAVILGPRVTISVAGCSALAAAVSAIAIYSLEFSRLTAFLAAVITVPHEVVLAVLLMRLMRSGKFDGRIDNVMGMALGYIIWFGVIPLFFFLWP